MPSLSLSLYSVLCPLHGCSSSAPRQADPVPTPSRPHHSLPLRSLRERDREIAVHFEQICTYWAKKFLPSFFATFLHTRLMNTEYLENQDMSVYSTKETHLGSYSFEA